MRSQGVMGLLSGLSGLVVMLIAWGVVWSGVEPPLEEVNRPASAYAPAGDLESQITYFLDRMKEDLQDPSRYGSRSRRVVRDANTVAVLALVLGNHDQPHRYRAAASGMLAAALELAASGQDHAAAERAYQSLVATTTAPGSPGELPWRAVADCEELMLQIPLLNNTLRNLVRSDERFAASRELASGLSATLASIAHVSMFHDTYCPGGANQEDWVELCVLMRDAAHDVNVAVREGDQQAAAARMKPLLRTCDDCHAIFKD